MNATFAAILIQGKIVSAGGVNMGHSMYNRIYLGRRTALFNLRRMWIAGLCTAAAGAVALVILALVR